MKTNLNIAYLNGAEGMIRRGAASSGGSGSGDSKMYFKFPDNMDEESAIGLICQFTILFGIIKNNNYIVIPSGSIIEAAQTSVVYKSVCTDPNIEIIDVKSGECITLDKFIQSNSDGMTLKEAFEMSGLTQITKEEFYSL